MQDSRRKPLADEQELPANGASNSLKTERSLFVNRVTAKLASIHSATDITSYLLLSIGTAQDALQNIRINLLGIYHE